ncbi:4-hydroxybenzoate polyprenyltransferase or related prenyltransferase [Halanaeroarchaeum sp. HSR-CO]|uniref:prenyltransferase n=1 Tax=Halanaeroarchaeum sp. HSR-CO TaxID=2866382 RepID=UPI0037C01FBC|nr:4-hydroxybenzoate polyprenyltransferase or related prenyltransferase [Halanaeroarchaeum sp. HSR-CO]
MPAGYLLRQSRPRFWLYLAGPVLVGLAFGADRPTDLLAILPVALFAYFLVPANVFLYGVNDVFDREIDRRNPKKADREVRYEGERATVIAVLASLALGLALLSLVPRPAAPWIAGFLVLGAAYSVPPVRLKVRPPLDSVSNGLYILPGGAAYAAIAGSQPPLLAVVGGWLWAMAMHTFSAVPDVEPDRQGGIRTTATVLGERGALLYCVFTWGLAAVAFGALDWRAGALLAVYPMVALWVAGRDVDVGTAYWYFPAINTVVGGLLTAAGLWRLAYA